MKKEDVVSSVRAGTWRSVSLEKSNVLLLVKLKKENLRKDLVLVSLHQEENIHTMLQIIPVWHEEENILLTRGLYGVRHFWHRFVSIEARQNSLCRCVVLKFDTIQRSHVYLLQYQRGLDGIYWNKGERNGNENARSINPLDDETSLHYVQDRKVFCVKFMSPWPHRAEMIGLFTAVLSACH